MHVNIVEQSVNMSKQLLTMNSYGTSATDMCPTASLICSNILAITDVPNVKKSGLEHKSDWRGNWSPEVARSLILLSNMFWGYMLWLVGYVLGIVFYSFVPKKQIGFYILPLGVALTLWVLFKKIKRESFLCYIGVGVFWTVIAVILDYLCIVRLFNSPDYYKMDVYLYYALTFVLPVAVGWYKKSKGLLHT